MDTTTQNNAAFTLHVSEDGLRLTLDGTLPLDDPAPFFNDLAEALKKRGVAAPPDAGTLASLLLPLADERGTLRGALLVEGRPSVPSRDARLEWARDFFAPGFVVDARTGAVDYRERKADLTVHAGQILATLHLAIKGEEGRDVFGGKLPVAPPQQERVRVGPNVRVEESPTEQRYFATLDGRLRWASGVLAVDDVYTIAGDVGLESGHIRHPGAVIIQGDVRAGSRVEAGGDVEVRGMVELSVIKAGGNLTVHGGIVGVGAEPIQAKGTVNARFIINARLRAGDGVYVANEIIHSDVLTRGPVTVPDGRIVAGEVVALGAVTAGTAGGEGLSQTLIAAGVDPDWAAEVTAREHEIKTHEKNLERIGHAVDHLTGRAATLTAKQKHVVADLLARRAEIERRITELRREVEEFTADSRARASAWILIRTLCHADVELQVEQKKLKLTKAREGPFRAKIMRHTLLILPGQSEGEAGETTERGRTTPAKSATPPAPVKVPAPTARH